MKNYLLILVGLVMMSSNASAARFGLMGGVDYNLDNTSGSVLGVSYGTKGGLGFGGGLVVDFSSIELGAMYISRSYTTTIAGVGTTSSLAGIEIPLMYRFGGNTSFGIGGFYDIPTGSATSNYGLTAGPRFASAGGLFLDLRFNYGLSTGNSKDILGMVGYYFGK